MSGKEDWEPKIYLHRETFDSFEQCENIIVHKQLKLMTYGLTNMSDYKIKKTQVEQTYIAWNEP